jgi:hypothetical protein
MARVSKRGSEEIGHPVIGECFDVALSLKPAELEALIARLCSCGIRRVKANAARSVRRRCVRRLRAEWCRLGERAAGSSPYVETRLG